MPKKILSIPLPKKSKKKVVTPIKGAGDMLKAMMMEKQASKKKTKKMPKGMTC